MRCNGICSVLRTLSDWRQTGSSDAYYVLLIIESWLGSLERNLRERGYKPVQPDSVPTVTSRRGRVPLAIIESHTPKSKPHRHRQWATVSTLPIYHRNAARARFASTECEGRIPPCKDSCCSKVQPQPSPARLRCPSPSRTSPVHKRLRYTKPSSHKHHSITTLWIPNKSIRNA